MGLYEFNLLNDTDKGNTIWNEGTYLATKENSTGVLYSIGDFFVEVVYDKDSNKIAKLISFKSKRLLEPYLSNISISTLE